MNNKTYKIICNDGAVTEEMNIFSARKYADRLRELGNYNVWLVKVK